MVARGEEAVGRTLVAQIQTRKEEEDSEMRRAGRRTGEDAHTDGGPAGRVGQSGRRGRQARPAGEAGRRGRQAQGGAAAGQSSALRGQRGSTAANQ